MTPAARSARRAFAFHGLLTSVLAAAVAVLGTLAIHAPTTPATTPAGTPTKPSAAPSQLPGDPAMRLGIFSVSLVVKDIAASRAFYEKLGFKMVGGDQSKNWVVLQNETTKIGLFQGMFDKNMLTFNPGWDSKAATLTEFEDVRDLQKALKARGLTPNPAADESTTGPAYFMLTDPDGNPILVDQHVPSPTSAKK